MENIVALGKNIKNKRLSLNMRMDDVAKQANITRATLWSIEKGEGKCSIASLFNVMSVLGLSFDVKSGVDKKTKRNRATRINSLQDKKINGFIIMCVEQYADSVNKSSGSVYREMLSKGLIKDMINDYEDLHGMSKEYLNDYISKRLCATEKQSNNESEHQLAKMILITRISELIAKQHRLSLDEARNALYKSRIIDLIDDDETGLYGESPLYIFSLFEQEKQRH